MLRPVVRLTVTTMALLAVSVGALTWLGWSPGAVAAMAAFVVIWVVIGAGMALSDYLAMLLVLVALAAIGITARAVMLAADGTAGYGHLLAIAAAMVVSFAAGIACGSLFQAEPDRYPGRRHQTAQ